VLFFNNGTLFYEFQYFGIKY